jgi:hypothetical protein
MVSGMSPTTFTPQFRTNKSVVELAAKLGLVQAPLDSTTKDERKSLPPK